MDPASHEVVYPDIDENVQYPWQGTQQESFPHEDFTSVIDPRLYRDLFPQNIPENLEQGQDQEQNYSTDEADDVPGEVSEAYQLNGADEGEDDSDFVYSEDESERYIF